MSNVMSTRVGTGLYQNFQLQTNNASKAVRILSARFFLFELCSLHTRTENGNVSDIVIC